MSLGHIFISHASADDVFIRDLRRALESHDLSVWVDSRQLRGSDELWPELAKAIASAAHFIVVFSPASFASGWVQRELAHALELEKQRQADGFRVIPLLLDDFPKGNLNWVFKDERIYIPARSDSSGVAEAMKPLLAALKVELPEDPLEEAAASDADATPLAELVLHFADPVIELVSGEHVVKATAKLTYEPADKTAEREVTSSRFKFAAPFRPLDADELRWYLEKFAIWPAGIYEDRAALVEAQLPKWGQALHQAIANETTRKALTAWEQAAGKAERRFSIMVDDDPIAGASATEQQAAAEAANALLTLPWELLRDGDTYLFQGAQPARVRRRLPNRSNQPTRFINLPIRILLVSPRPEEEGVSYIDHRVSARPLVEALDSLGELAELTVLAPATFKALQETLLAAHAAGRPFDVIHFDGHGVYDRRVGLGQLCFEEPNDGHKLSGRAVQLVNATDLAAIVHQHRVPLVFLEACQSAQVENAGASVAAKLLEGGVTSVVAMTHSVLVETARRFVTVFYRSLSEGKRVGAAMLDGQRELHADTWRGRITGAGDFRLQDWFVPVLYQEAHDPRLIARRLSGHARRLTEKRRAYDLGKLPPPPPHSFIGRSRALLALERLLAQPTPPELSYAVVRGRGGEGKTTLAVELARWLVRTKRFARAAFVSLEQYTDARGVLDRLGQQLLGPSWQHPQFDEALLLVERELRERATIIVLDNCESVLAEYSPTKPHQAEHEENHVPLAASSCSPSCDFVDEIAPLCQTLLRADARTRLVFTSREALPEPFALAAREIKPRALDTDEAIELVSEVLKTHGDTVQYDNEGRAPQDILDLIEAAQGHARALTKLAGEIGRRRLRDTIVDYRQLMADLDARHPGDRENSLYASVALSLRRLPPELREQVKALAVFHGGAHLQVIDQMLETADDDVETVQELAAALIAVGLAEAMPYGHLRLDPALPNYLLAQTDAAELPALTSRWAEAMRRLTRFLYQQQFQDAQLAAQLTLLELPNLLALLNLAADTLPPEAVVDLADSVESLLARLGRPQALAHAVSVRTAAARRLGAWSHAQFLNASKNIDRLLEQGDLQAAFAAAQQLLARCQSAGTDAYPGAAYDYAMAYFRLGRVLKKGGAAEEALAPLAAAEQRFQSLAEAGDVGAAKMASAAITERADCLRDLGRYDEAAAAYEAGIRRAEASGDRRTVAAGKFQLGTVRMLQKRYAEALERYAEARETSAALGEPGTVATIWHQIGIVHKETGQFDQAEHAYRQSLALEVQQKNRAGEAASLGELGNLYDQMGRLEEAATFHRQAAEIYAKLPDLRSEGFVRNNLAGTLIKLQRYDEARRELRRALECKKPLGHAAQLWVTWDILHNLEQATGHAQAAAEAREQAVAAYLAYRRAGGESQSNTAPLFALVAQALQDGSPDALTAAAAQLAARVRPNNPAWYTALLDKLHIILRGDRDPALAADPALDYDDAVELQLLLEGLGTQAA